MGYVHYLSNCLLEDNVHSNPQRVQDSSDREIGADARITADSSGLPYPDLRAGSGKQRALEPGCFALSSPAPVLDVSAPVASCPSGTLLLSLLFQVCEGKIFQQSKFQHSLYIQPIALPLPPGS